MPSRLSPDENRAYMREYMKRRYHRRMEAFKVQLGSQCQRCGNTKDLEFDHIDRRSKTARGNVISNLCNKAIATVTAELTKCQLLCRDCHIEKGHEAGDLPPNAQHGTHAMYRHHGCRCAPCRAAKSKLNRDYARGARNKTNR